MLKAKPAKEVIPQYLSLFVGLGFATGLRRYSLQFNPLFAQDMLQVCCCYDVLSGDQYNL